MSKANNLSSIEELFKHASPEVQQIITQVLEIEKSRIENSPTGRINEDILKIVKEAVQ